MRAIIGPEWLTQLAHGPVRDRDAALREQILDVTKAQCEPEIEPNRLMYGLGREPISGVAEFPHNFGCSAYLHPTSCRRRDKARRHVPHGLIAVIVIAAVWNLSLKILFRLVLSGSLDPVRLLGFPGRVRHDLDGDHSALPLDDWEKPCEGPPS
jgi:hypothetical protein